MSAEALNCPNCGAGVSSDSSLCKFCQTRLKTIACPQCFGMMFLGSKFCGHCGAIAAPIEVVDNEKRGMCPRCREDLGLMQIESTSIRGCSKCDGLWLDASTFESVCADRERQSAVLGSLHKRKKPPAMLTKVNYVPCPDCSQLMNRNNFGRASGIIVDICRDHGVWFDAEELPSIIEFVRKGGMEIARQRERNELRDERERLREEQRRSAAMDRRHGTAKVLEQDERDGISRFVHSLFDL